MIIRTTRDEIPELRTIKYGLNYWENDFYYVGHMNQNELLFFSKKINQELVIIYGNS